MCAVVQQDLSRNLNCSLFQDCIMMPMCACSVCDECARTALTEAENNNNACPACGEPDNSPEDLIPCRKVRERVNDFKSKNSGAAAAKVRRKKRAHNIYNVSVARQWAALIHATFDHFYWEIRVHHFVEWVNITK